MRYGSVCSGVEAASTAWEPLGWKPEWFCEFDKFPSAVLAHHWPDVPNLGDMTTIENNEVFNDKPIDLLVGGTPCQSFSIAGLRKGMGDERGNLALKYCDILMRKQPRWFVWENVPGVLSSNNGRDFAAILSGFQECGYGIAYRVLDAQYFGVPQRRRRVFVVGYLGDWRPAAAVLFERESLQGHPAPSREKGKETAGYTPSSFGGYSKGVGTVRAAGGDYGGGSETLVPGKSKCLTAHGQRNDAETETFVVSTAHTKSNGTGVKRDGTSYTLEATSSVGQAVCFTQNDAARDASFDIAPTLRSGNGGGAINQAFSRGLAVRRLTPLECERLQGFPDNHTQIPWRNKDDAECPDGPRYKAMGNSMAVPVMRWIGERIQFVEDTI